MSSTILPLLHVTQTLLALYTGFLSYNSIRRVQQYESISEKAAKYSNVAEHHLKTTRSTQGAGAVATASSLGLSAWYLVVGDAGQGGLTGTVLCTVEALALLVAHRHVSAYWKGKAKVPLPGSGDYNDAITSSNRMRRCLGVLAVTWGFVAVWCCVLWESE